MSTASRSRTPAPVDRPDTTAVRRARRIVRVLDQTYPDACCELDFQNPFELLVATVLSAQTTDRRVNAATPALFARFPDARALAAADRDELESFVRTTGFYRAKAGSLLGLSQALCARFGGEVPGRMDDLVTLPGVGRKTANVVLGDAFGVPGITVDTHVMRLAVRFGWSSPKADPDRIEQDIAALIPKREWTRASHLVIWHGRRCCHAKKPACGACPLARLCPSFGIGPTDPATARALLRDEGPA